MTALGAAAQVLDNESQLQRDLPSGILSCLGAPCIASRSPRLLVALLPAAFGIASELGLDQQLMDESTRKPLRKHAIERGNPLYLFDHRHRLAACDEIRASMWLAAIDVFETNNAGVAKLHECPVEWDGEMALDESRNRVVAMRTRSSFCSQKFIGIMLYASTCIIR